MGQWRGDKWSLCVSLPGSQGTSSGWEWVWQLLSLPHLPCPASPPALRTGAEHTLRAVPLHSTFLRAHPALPWLTLAGSCHPWLRNNHTDQASAALWIHLALHAKEPLPHWKVCLENYWAVSPSPKILLKMNVSRLESKHTLNKDQSLQSFFENLFKQLQFYNPL